MTAALVSALLALNPAPPSNHDPFRGSQEHVTPQHSTSSGFTLDKLHGMPMVRPTWSPQQYQVYQPYVWVYPAYSYGGLGGYYPPGTGRSYSPLSFGFGRRW
jgi:hypothetical protein